MTDDPAVPIPRAAAYDKLARRIEEMADRRLREHHAIRLLHRINESGRCRCCREVHPCSTLKIIDLGAVV